MDVSTPSTELQMETPAIVVVPPSPDSIADTRIDAIVRRFSWFANPSHQWPAGSPSPMSTSPPRPSNIHFPTPYHLRRRPQIRCPACLGGELGQLAHMEGPYGCLYDSEADRVIQLNRTQSNFDDFYNVENE